ncbi:MAG: hypothetical protein AAFQ35_04790 [Pseudomonadota bacterium]
MVTFTSGVLCDTADQMAEIISHFGKRSLQAVIVELNARTRRRSCGLVRGGRVKVRIEPHRIVSSPGGKMLIVRLTTGAGEVQYTWRRLGEKPGGGARI